MNVLIVGCGKVGSSLASTLSKLGHDVSVVDSNADNFDALDNSFSGITIEGVPIDQDILKSAGIQGCDAVVAVTPTDNMNLMVSQIAKEIFNVPNIICRVSDPQRERLYLDYGFKTICPNSLTIDSINTMISGGENVKNVSFKGNTVSFVTMPVTKHQDGEFIRDLDLGKDENLFAVIHKNGKFRLITPSANFHVYMGDMLVVSRALN